MCNKFYFVFLLLFLQVFGSIWRSPTRVLFSWPLRLRWILSDLGRRVRVLGRLAKKGESSILCSACMWTATTGLCWFFYTAAWQNCFSIQKVISSTYGNMKLLQFWSLLAYTRRRVASFRFFYMQNDMKALSCRFCSSMCVLSRKLIHVCGWATDTFKW